MVWTGRLLEWGWSWVKSCRTRNLKFHNLSLSDTPSVALSKPSIRQTWLSYPVGDLVSAHLHKTFQPPGTILRASKALREKRGDVYSVGGCSISFCGQLHALPFDLDRVFTNRGKLVMETFTFGGSVAPLQHWFEFWQIWCLVVSWHC